MTATRSCAASVRASSRPPSGPAPFIPTHGDWAVQTERFGRARCRFGDRDHSRDSPPGSTLSGRVLASTPSREFRTRSIITCRSPRGGLRVRGDLRTAKPATRIATAASSVAGTRRDGEHSASPHGVVPQDLHGHPGACSAIVEAARIPSKHSKAYGRSIVSARWVGDQCEWWLTLDDE